MEYIKNLDCLSLIDLQVKNTKYFKYSSVVPLTLHKYLTHNNITTVPQTEEYNNTLKNLNAKHLLPCV